MCVGGILMSTIATSGRRDSTRRSSSSASAALPTTSKPASVSRRARPSRSSIASSAITTRTAAPRGRDTPVARAVDLERPVERADAILEVGRAARRGPRPLRTSTTSTAVRCAAADARRASRGRGASVSAIDEVGGRLDAAPSSRSSGSSRTLIRPGDASTSVSTAAARPSSASTAGKMPCASSRSSATRGAQLGLGLVEPALELGRRRRGARPQQPQRERERRRAAAARRRGGRARAGGAPRLRASTMRAREARRLASCARSSAWRRSFSSVEPRRGDHLLDEPGVGEQRRVVDERGDRRSVALERRNCAPRAWFERDGPAVRVDPPAAARGAVGELQARVAERACEGVACAAGLGRLGELDDESRHRRARPARPDDAPRDAGCDGDEHDGFDPPQPDGGHVVAEHPGGQAVAQPGSDEAEVDRGGSDHRQRDRPPPRRGRRGGPRAARARAPPPARHAAPNAAASRRRRRRRGRARGSWGSAGIPARPGRRPKPAQARAARSLRRSRLPPRRVRDSSRVGRSGTRVPRVRGAAGKPPRTRARA